MVLPGVNLWDQCKGFIDKNDFVDLVDRYYLLILNVCEVDEIYVGQWSLELEKFQLPPNSNFSLTYLKSLFRCILFTVQ